MADCWMVYFPVYGRHLALESVFLVRMDLCIIRSDRICFLQVHLNVSTNLLVGGIVDRSLGIHDKDCWDSMSLEELEWDWIVESGLCNGLCCQLLVYFVVAVTFRPVSSDLNGDTEAEEEEAAVVKGSLRRGSVWEYHDNAGLIVILLEGWLLIISIYLLPRRAIALPGFIMS